MSDLPSSDDDVAGPFPDDPLPGVADGHSDDAADLDEVLDDLLGW